MRRNDLPVEVSFSFYSFYRGVYPVPQKNKEKIKKRKVPVVGDIMQTPSYEDLIFDFDEAYYEEFFK